MLTTAPHLQVRRPSPTTAEFTVTTCPAPTFSNRLLFSVVFVLRISLALTLLLLLYSTWPLSSPFYNPDASAAGTAVVAPSTAAHSTAAAASQTQWLNESSAAVNRADADGDLPPEVAAAIVGGEEGGPEGSDPSAAAAAAAAAQQQPALASAPTVPAGPPSPTTLLTPAWLPYALFHLHTSRTGALLASLASAIPPSLFVPLCLALLYATTLRIHTTESLLVLRGLGIQTSSSGGSFLASWRAGTRFIPTEKIRDVLINEAFKGFGVRYYLVVVVDGEDDVVVVFPRLLPGRRVVEGVWRGVRGCLWEPQEGGASGARRWEDKTVNG